MTDVVEVVTKTVDQLQGMRVKIQHQAEDVVEQAKIQGQRLMDTVDKWMKEKGKIEIEHLAKAIVNMKPVDESPTMAKFLLETYSWAAICLLGFFFGQIMGGYLLGFFLEILSR